MRNVPDVLASRDGARALQIVGFDGVRGVPNRDAIAYRFDVRNSPNESAFPLNVIFSGSVYAVRAYAFDLPEVEDREKRFVQFALAAIGDSLDQGPIEDAQTDYVGNIECFSPHFQAWRERAPVTAAEIRRYLQAHVYWAWEFDLGTTTVGMPDILRLGTPLETLIREARLYDSDDWTIATSDANSITLKPVPSFVKRVRESGLFSGTPESTEVPASEEGKEAVAEHPQSVAGLTYVDEARISELRRIDSDVYDLTRTVALCDQLNVCYRSQCYLAVAALLRTLLDHMAPIFGFDSFTQAANNYGGGATFRRNAIRLGEAARDVANMSLHRRISRKETVPNRVQVHFAQELDIVLEEVVRILG